MVDHRRRRYACSGDGGYTLLIEVEGVPHAISEPTRGGPRGVAPSWSRCTWSSLD